MLTEFLLKRKMAGLIRCARDGGTDQWTSIAELGTLPPTDESIACLIELSRKCQQDYHAGNRAVSALGMLNDRRATDHLVGLIREKQGRIEDVIGKALAYPHHAGALPELAEMARVQCAVHDDVFQTHCLVDLMRSINPAASQPYIEALAPLVLKSALQELPQNKPTYGRPSWGESILSLCQQTAGRVALQTLRDALVKHHRQIIMTSGQFDKISESLDWLRKSIQPAAVAAVAEFLRTPSRQITKSVSHLVSDDDDPAVKYEWHDESCYTSELGQPAGPEEVAEEQAFAKAREAYADAEATRRHRENIYPVLLDHGTPDDLATYARLCLTQPCYDLFVSYSRHDPGVPKLNRLAAMLRHVQTKPRAAELLRLILAGDRTQLWASVREALAKGIDWKPQAVELLEQTQYPALDDLLASWIEGEWSTGKPSSFTASLASRNPAQLAGLAAQHLLSGTSSAARLEARQSVLASEDKALQVARQLYQRGTWSDRRDALAIASSLTSPAAEAELRAWLVTETDRECLAEVEERRDAKFVQQCKAAAVAESPPEKPEPSPPVAVDHATLWKRVQSCLRKRGVPMDDSATPGDLARRADERLGTREVSRFVFEYYYPSAYGESLAPDVVATAQAWVEQFERGS